MPSGSVIARVKNLALICLWAVLWVGLAGWFLYCLVDGTVYTIALLAYPFFCFLQMIWRKLLAKIKGHK